MASIGLALHDLLTNVDTIIRRRVIVRRYGRAVGIFNGDNATIVRAWKKALQTAGTDFKREFIAQMKRDIAVTTKSRTGRLGRGPKVQKRTRGNTITLIEDFPQTAFRSRRGSGQYAYVVNAPGGGNRKFISHTKGVINAKANTILARHFARVSAVQRRNRK